MAWGGPPGSPMAGRERRRPERGRRAPVRRRAPRSWPRRSRPSSTPSPSTPSPRSTSATASPRPPSLSLRTFLRPHRRGLLAAFGLVVLETITLQAGPLLTQIGIDHGVTEGDYGVLVAVTAAYLVSILISVLAGTARISFTGRLGERLMYQLRLRVFSHLQRLSLDFYTDEKAGRLMTRMTSDIESLTQLFQEGLVNLAVQGSPSSWSPSILFSLNPALAGITLLIVVPVMLVLTLWFRAASDRGYTLVRDRIADVLADLQESLSGIRIVAAHNRRRHNVASHRNIVGEYRDANLYTARVGAIYGPGTEVVGVAGPGDHPARRRGDGARRPADRRRADRLPPLPHRLLRPDPAAGPALQHVPAGAGRAHASCGTCWTPSPACPRPPMPSDLPPLEGEIVLRDVSFAYEPGRPVLDGVDLRIAPGETFALVGPTGAGQVDHRQAGHPVLRPDAGAVLIDGHDLRDVTIDSLRRQLGVVPQEPFLFNGSIRDNIAFARPDATEDEVWDACRAVGIDDLVERLPEGLDTPVHERGVVAVVGRAPAAGPGPGVPRPPAGAGARRGHVEPRPGQRGPASSAPSTSCSRGAPPSSSPTGWPPPCGPTASRWSSTAASSSWARTTSWCAGRGRTPPCTPPGRDMWDRGVTRPGHSDHWSPR